MKRSISILLCLVLIFSSFTFAFAADWTTTQISSVVNNTSTIASNTGTMVTTLSNIYSRLGTIMGYLFDDSHSIAYWTSAIASWMQPIYAQLTSGLVSETDIIPIISGLNEVVSSGGNTTYYPYLKYNGKSNAEWVSLIPDYFELKSYPNYYRNHPTDNYLYYFYNGQFASGAFQPGSVPILGALLYMLQGSTVSEAYGFTNLLTGFNTQQSLVSFADPDSTVTFTPLSATDGIYKYLNAINTPLARLGYVLASDSRIEAQEAAAANEQAVVDNFIDSTGDGAVPTSSFSDVSGLSFGITSNLSTDASPAQIWDIFNSDHGSWFSQETANQLDTTTRTRGSEFETPLLDQQMEEIYKSLGGGK